MFLTGCKWLQKCETFFFIFLLLQKIEMDFFVKSLSYVIYNGPVRYHQIQ